MLCDPVDATKDAWGRKGGAKDTSIGRITGLDGSFVTESAPRGMICDPVGTTKDDLLDPLGPSRRHEG